MDNNICHFIPHRKDYNSLQTVHFVLETKQQNFGKMKTESLYKMYLVRSGSGALHTSGRIYSLMPGSIFFTIPGNSFCIEGKENLSYFYISFLGVRGNMLLDKLKISVYNCVFNGNAEISEMWEKSIAVKGEWTDLVSESVLLRTFAYLGERLWEDKSGKNSGAECVNLIKKYIDDNFSDEGFSLEKIAASLNYNKKYISHIFKKKMNVGVNEYLTVIRIQNACTMMEQGTTSVNDIAARCGFRDAQYFSKVFKSKTGRSPTKYIKDVKEK